MDVRLRRITLFHFTLGGAAVASLTLIAAHALAGGGKLTQTQLPSTVEDFFEPGTQENTLGDPLLAPSSCQVCHEFDLDGNRKQVVPPFDNWRASLMGQAARDPVWHAALAVANQDADFSGDSCIRCHSPNAWLSGRSVPTDASAFTGGDWDGVSCNFCHRLVDPVANVNNPPEDTGILNELAMQGVLPMQPGNSRYVVDPSDVRRGPLDDVPANFHGVPIIYSPFHTKGQLCGTCHDVSNAMFTRQGDGTYALNAFNSAHPTLDPNDMMPEQRTYSEWANSTFASTGVYFPDHRFGGDHPTGIMKSCQDCHMPKNFGGVCVFWDTEPFFPRPDVPEHSFIGANTWVIGAVHDEYGQNVSNISPEDVDLNQARTQTNLRNASDMQVIQLGNQLKVRVINFSGHKLPTGYPEGRRMWLNVQFYDAKSNLISERGAYDFETATLTTVDTKVYEMKLAMDQSVAQASGLPAGESHHLVLNNVVTKDNRIPPIGFSNAAFAGVGAAPVGYTYANGQYWDDTVYGIPPSATQALVTLYYQTTSREYIEFLRDTNTTNDRGQNAYNRWLARGMSAPVDMDMQMVPLGVPRPGDVNHDGHVNVTDLLAVINQWGPCPAPNLCSGDVNGDGAINVNDLLLVINNWG